MTILTVQGTFLKRISPAFFASGWPMMVIFQMSSGLDNGCHVF